MDVSAGAANLRDNGMQPVSRVQDRDSMGAAGFEPATPCL
jgi:hypothetical protein